MSHQLQEIYFPALRLQRNLADASLTIEGVQEIVRRHGVGYEFWREWSASGLFATYVGYMLNLCGVNDGDDCADECHVPGCQYCHRTYDDLRKVAEWMIPKDAQESYHCEIEPFDGTRHIVQRQGESRKEIVVTIKIQHRLNVNAPANDCQRRCLNEMRAKLADLGLHEGVSPLAEAAAS